MQTNENHLVVLRINFKVQKCCAGLRNSVTAIVISCVFSVSFLSRAAADFDFGIGAYTRSYPLSGVLTTTLGYGKLLWGAQGSPWYGYLRPKLEAASSGTYNSIDGGLEFCPISFLGVRAGGESAQNDADYKAYDCVTNICKGRFYRTYLNAELTLGAGPIFTQVRYRRERLTLGRGSQNQPGTHFIEPTAGIALPVTGGRQTVWRGMLGVKLNRQWTIIGGYVATFADQVDGASRMPYGLVRYTSASMTVGIGGGVFSSPLKEKEAIALGYLEWEILPSLALR